MHKDYQLRATHIILGYKPYTKHFQSQKNIIKAKDAWLALIDIAVLGFLLIEPFPAGTQDTLLPAPLATRFLYSQEPPIPSDDKAKEPILEPTHQEVTDKDFKVFYQQKDPENAPNTSYHHLRLAQISTNQEVTNILKGKRFEEKTPDLFTLHMAHAEGSFLAMAMVPRLPIPAPAHTSSVDAANKKRKRA